MDGIVGTSVFSLFLIAPENVEMVGSKLPSENFVMMEILLTQMDAVDFVELSQVGFAVKYKIRNLSAVEPGQKQSVETESFSLDNSVMTMIWILEMVAVIYV